MTNLKKSWNTIAGHYARRYRISTDTVHYGPLCPGEDKLGLLGDIAGRRALDLGCGGGQNAVALARMGAHVTAVDFSEAQIAAAEQLARRLDMPAEFMISDIGELPGLSGGAFDLVISVCAIAFVKDETRVFREAFRLLRPGGRFVLSDMHPLQYILDEARRGVEFNHPYPFAPFRMRWRWDFEGPVEDPEICRRVEDPGCNRRVEDPAVQALRALRPEWERSRGKRSRRGGAPQRSRAIDVGFEHYVRSVPHYCNALIAAGFTVTRILEPKPTSRSPHRGFSREILREYPYIAKNLPITYIIQANKGA